MSYFRNFNKVLYDLSGNTVNPSLTLITNILQKVKVLEDIKNNILVYYTYTVKETDTPEIIAHKYYGDPNRHWIILLANNIVDPYYDWVMGYDQFNKYIVNKYGDLATAKATVHHYNKIISKIESQTGTIVINRYQIDEDTYTALPASATETIDLVDGTSVEITTTKEIVYCYDYENDLNEAKRTIKIIDKKYVKQIERELKNLLNV